MILSGVCVLLSACTFVPATISGIDSLISRETKPHPDTFLVSFTHLSSNKTEQIKIRCEQYYHAEFSTRGNGWRWRYIEKPAEYPVTLKDGQTAWLYPPQCADLIAMHSQPIKHLFLIFSDNRNTWLHKQDDKWIDRKYNPKLKKFETLLELPVAVKITKI